MLLPLHLAPQSAARMAFTWTSGWDQKRRVPRLAGGARLPAPPNPRLASSPREPAGRWRRGRGGSALRQNSPSRCAHISIFRRSPQHRLLQQVRRRRAGAQQSLDCVASCQHAAPGRQSRQERRPGLRASSWALHTRMPGIQPRVPDKHLLISRRISQISYPLETVASFDVLRILIVCKCGVQVVILSLCPPGYSVLITCPLRFNCRARAARKGKRSGEKMVLNVRGIMEIQSFLPRPSNPDFMHAK